MPQRRVIPACCLAIALWARGAAADVFHGNVALLGARASGLGGAAAGLPEEDAAPFYNPACVAQDPWVSVSFSAQALELEQRSFSPYLGGRATESQVALLPNASVGSFPWRGGRAAFAVFTTDAEGLTLDQSFGAGSGVADAHVRRVESGATYQLGPSYGRPVNDVLSVGFSALYVYRTTTQRAEEFADASDPNATVAAISHTVDSDGVSQGLAFVGGVRVQPTGPNGIFTLGLSLRSGVSLSEQVVTREERFTGARQPDGSILFTRQPSHVSTEATGGLPAAILLGASAKLGRALFAAQATLTSAQANVAPGVDARLLVDGAVGAELAIDQGWTGRAGVYTQRSSVAQSSAAAAHIDRYGGTLGVGDVEGHHVTDFALVLVREAGNAQLTSVTGGTDRASVSGYTLLFTLGGAFRF